MCGAVQRECSSGDSVAATGSYTVHSGVCSDSALASTHHGKLQVCFDNEVIYCYTILPNVMVTQSVSVSASMFTLAAHNCHALTLSHIYGNSEGSLMEIVFHAIACAHGLKPRSQPQRYDRLFDSLLYC